MDKRKIDPVELGKKLRVLRGIRTQVQVSRDTGLSQARLSNYEHGLKVPNDEAKVILSDYYGVSVQELFYDGEYNG